MSCQCSRGCIGDKSSRDYPYVTASNTPEQFSNGLNFGIIEGGFARVSVDTECINCGFVAGVEGSGGVCGISDERVDGVRHLMAEDRELVHHLFIIVSLAYANECFRYDSSILEEYTSFGKLGD
jgi:hypothetical protein